MSVSIISRRSFSKLLGVSTAYAALHHRSEAMARPSGLVSHLPTSPTIVRLSSNENPYGPSPAALKAMTDGFGLTWRYPDEYADMLADELAKLNQVPVNQILLGAGSGEILKLCAASFASPDKKLVMANPSFEAIGRHAGVANAEVVKVALTSDYRHDLEKMLEVSGGKATVNGSVGLIYICNPNNPTGSITPKSELAAFLTKVPATTMVVVDEAYHHYAETKDYESVIPLVKDHPNLIVLRTFSKIYGMAGLRCGYCVSQPNNLGHLTRHQFFDSVNILAILAALASLKDRDHVDKGRQLNSDVKKHLCTELDSLGYRYIQSHTNFIMIDLRREVRPVIAALRERNVEVGRLFPALPTFMRVTIGTDTQMQSFMTSLKEVMT